MEAASRTERVVLGARSTGLVLRDPEATAYGLLVLLGAAFAIVGLADLTLLWVPLRLGNVNWEFAAVSRTFASIPMSGLGLGLVAYGLVRHPGAHPRLVQASAVFFGAWTSFLLLLGFIYVTALPSVIRDPPRGGFDALGTTIVKTSIEIVVYSLTFGVIAFILWRAVKKE